MGWRERDWARFDDGEREAIFGTSGLPGAGDEVRRTRPVFWVAAGAIAMLAAFLALHGNAAGGAADAAPPVLFGLTGAIADGPSGGGPDSVCTELIAGSTGGWGCIGWTNNPNHIPVVTPQAYPGTCGHLQVDETHGRWVCLSEDSPLGVAPAPSPS